MVGGSSPWPKNINRSIIYPSCTVGVHYPFNRQEWPISFIMFIIRKVTNMCNCAYSHCSGIEQNCYQVRKKAYNYIILKDNGENSKPI